MLDALDERIRRAREARSPLGYFPALYRKVTARVKLGIERGEFEDGPRMERLDVVFANRYLDAAAALDAGQPATQCWQVCWEAGRSPRTIVLQHLLLGMNAHINLDLGIAAAQVAPGSSLAGLEGDFDRINTILASLVGGVEKDLGRIWPTFRWFDRTLGTTDTALANFSMQKARDGAWGLATRLAPLAEAEQAGVIRAQDAEMAIFGRFLWHPGWLPGLALAFIRSTERGSVAQRIEWLER